MTSRVQCCNELAVGLVTAAIVTGMMDPGFTSSSGVSELGRIWQPFVTGHSQI